MTAANLVFEDMNQNENPFLTVDEALLHARNVLALPGSGCAGAMEIEDYGDDLSQAYFMVLSTDELLGA